MDAAIHHNPNDVNNQLRLFPKGPRRVFLIDNFDKAVPELADALLKPMEADRTPETPTTFILIARDLDDVRAAGQSRCQVERLDALSDDEARRLCIRMMAGSGIGFADDHAIETLVIGSRGFPKRVADACAASQGFSVVTAAQVRQALGIDWGTPLLEFWLSLFTNGQSIPVPSDAAHKSRFVLSELLGCLRVGRRGGSREPALSLVDEKLIHGLLHEVRQKAEAMLLPPEVLLSDLGEVIRQDDFDGAIGPIELQGSLRAKLRVR